jgi:hypothetical protein
MRYSRELETRAALTSPLAARKLLSPWLSGTLWRYARLRLPALSYTLRQSHGDGCTTGTSLHTLSILCQSYFKHDRDWVWVLLGQAESSFFSGHLIMSAPSHYLNCLHFMIKSAVPLLSIAVILWLLWPSLVSRSTLMESLFDCWNASGSTRFIW